MGPRRNLLQHQADLLAAAARFGAWDPWLNTARFLGVSRWGPGIGAMVAASAKRFPRQAAVVDDAGSITYADLDRQATSLAVQLRRLARSGRVPTQEAAVGILSRNHRGFILTHVAAERAGIDVVMLSPALPPARLNLVIGREGVTILVADGEFHQAVAEAHADVTMITADPDSDVGATEDQARERLELADLAGRRSSWCPPPSRRARLVLLTSGTTGPPKGARRTNKAPDATNLGLVTQIPYQMNETYLVAPPLFHAWGLSQATMALATSSTLILRRKFDAAEFLGLVEEGGVDVVAVVPLMMRRMLRQLGPRSPEARPRLVLSSGNVLNGTLALAWMDRFGDQLYNIYGSTEAAVGTIADPGALRSAPGTVGRPPPGVTLSILDEGGMPVPANTMGRVFVSSSMQFSGYSDGTDRDRSGTLMATGDLGYLDHDGLLHIDGRANDMIVTGGENVFPSRVEEVLDQFPGVELSAVIGTPDEEYGQRVVAFVVARPGWDLDLDALRHHASAELQRFMVPKDIHLVDALPMTVTGKVIRHGLAVLGQARHA